MNPRRTEITSSIVDNHVFDAVVVGGGVNGIGVFRDLSLQGLRVLLVEQNDFCSGCSAAPSRMIHGGLRYLENGEFDLVKESLRERDALLRNAPHMVRPLPTVIPITSLTSGLFNSAASFFRINGKPSARGLIPIRLGLWLYDWVTRHRRQLPKHRVLGRTSTRQRWPFLTKKTKYAAVFYDAWISHPERLCIELLRDTEKAAPQSFALNYAELQRDGDKYAVRDNIGGADIPIAPKVIVNATGAWLDDVSALLKDGLNERMVSGTKGSHLILNNPELHDALDGHMVYFENSDGRVCIVFPYQGRVLAGSTDIRVDKVTRVKCEVEESEYILTSLNTVFESIKITADQVVFSYSGIRPLPRSNADFTGRISRGHCMRRVDGDVPQFCMIGGKWTTFRAFGEQAADEILRELGVPRRVSTLDMPIGGGARYPGKQETLEQELQREHGIGASRATHLVSHYGSTSLEVAEIFNGTALSANTEYTTAEIAHLFDTEYATSVSDVVLRRTSLAIRGDLDGEILDRVTEVVADRKSLSPAEALAERQALVDELITYHGASKEKLASMNDNWSTECA